MASTSEELSSGLLGGGVAALVLYSQANTMKTGALYSAGMELVTGFKNTPGFHSGNAPVMQIGSRVFTDSPLGKSGSLFTQSNLPAGFSSLDEAALKQTDIANRRLTNSGFRTSAANMIIPIAGTAIFGAMAYSEGGGEALGRFAIEDVMANYYGNIAAQNIGTLNSSNQGRLASSLSADVKALNQGTMTQNYRTIMGSSIVGRTMPVLAAYSGANLGFEVGQSIGEGLNNVLFAGEGSSLLGISGGILGAAGGAKLGAMAGSSLFSLATSALLVGGAMVATEVTGNILSSGFKRTKTLGLDFAGDLSSYNTRSAVTMRQRSIQAMNKSHLNARSALGQEASFHHMNRDYFANYRRF